MDTRPQQSAMTKRVASYISRQVGKAICDYGMIEDGDRIMVAVSGGKDSLSLLKIMQERRSFVPVKYEIVAVHIDMCFFKCCNLQALENYLSCRGWPFINEKIKLPLDKKEEINCFWCSWNRRKHIFQLAGRLGYRKVALGHHLDDIIQTFLLNLFFHGEIAAMNPRQELFGGEITIIRPLCYVEERFLSQYAQLNELPVASCRCPNAASSRRNLIKELIQQVAKEYPEVKKNIFRSPGRIKWEYLPLAKKLREGLWPEAAMDFKREEIREEVEI